MTIRAVQLVTGRNMSTRNHQLMKPRNRRPLHPSLRINSNNNSSSSNSNNRWQMMLQLVVPSLSFLPYHPKSQHLPPPPL